MMEAYPSTTLLGLQFPGEESENRQWTGRKRRDSQYFSSQGGGFSRAEATTTLRKQLVKII